MRRIAGVVAGAVLLGAPAAHAENGYEAHWVSQSPPNGTVIESGEVIKASMRFTNIGTLPWNRPLGARLGPSGADAGQRDRASALQAPSWLAPNRIATMNETSVPVGKDATFDFEFKGPPASSPYAVHEVIAPLHDGDAQTPGGWMDNGPEIKFGNIYYDFEIRPSVAPTVTLDAAPAAVTVGDTVPVTATAADNVRVAGVFARIDQGPVASLSGSPAQGSVATTGLPAGAHTLTVAAVDGAGNVTSTTAPLTISASQGLPNGTPAGAATLTAGLTRKRRAKVVTAFGRGAEIGGRLRVPQTNAPIAGARLQVLARRQGSRRLTLVGEVATDAQGRYQTRVPAGPSRSVSVVYRAMTAQADPTASRTVALRTRAGVRLAVKRRGRVVRLTGSVPGDPFPGTGVLVSLQGRQAGDRWRPFKNVRAKGAKRRFAARYRFSGPGRFRLRAVVNEQPGYPYARGVSKARRVVVR